VSGSGGIGEERTTSSSQGELLRRIRGKRKKKKEKGKNALKAASDSLVSKEQKKRMTKKDQLPGTRARNCFLSYRVRGRNAGRKDTRQK